MISSSSIGNIQLNTNDLICIQLSWVGGALPNGVCISLLANSN
jgi:hypothetical protein